jgi:ubiquinone biosynthesis protein Coq4
MEGEIQLHAFTAAQLHFARFYLTMLAKNLLKTAIDAIEQADRRMDALIRGWMMGKQAHPCLVSVGTRYGRYLWSS